MTDKNAKLYKLPEAETGDLLYSINAVIDNYCVTEGKKGKEVPIATIIGVLKLAEALLIEEWFTIDNE